MPSRAARVRRGDAAQLETLVAKGALGGLFFSDRRLPGDLRGAEGAGVEFSQEPTEQPYGVDAGFRDPSGNQMRMAQLSVINCGDPRGGDEFCAAARSTLSETTRAADRSGGEHHEHPEKTPLLARLAHLIVRRRRWVIGVWVVLDAVRRVLRRPGLEALVRELLDPRLLRLRGEPADAADVRHGRAGAARRRLPHAPATSRR